MLVEPLSRRIIEDLFFEQDVDVLAVSYRHGLLRSLAVLVRSLLLSARWAAHERDSIGSGASVAVVFFKNEFEAISKASSHLRIDHIVRLNLHALGLVRHELGLVGMVREIVRFIRLAVAIKGRSYLGRLTYPLLGWLLYRTFQALLAGKHDVTVITTNMHHPLSLGVAWAAITMGQSADFYEHATTPRVVARNRGYRNVYVHFEHTGRMLTESGFHSRQVHVLQRMDRVEIAVPDEPVRRVGLCINFFDSLAAIEDVTDVLVELKCEISLRIHDADPRLEQLKRLAKRHGATISDARQSSIGAYLGMVDLVVAGNSNVVADALLARRSVVYYWSGDPSMFDYYGLVAHYHLPHARDKASLRTLMARLVDTAAVC